MTYCIQATMDAWRKKYLMDAIDLCIEHKVDSSLMEMIRDTLKQSNIQLMNEKIMDPLEHVHENNDHNHDHNNENNDHNNENNNAYNRENSDHNKINIDLTSKYLIYVTHGFNLHTNDQSCSLLQSMKESMNDSMKESMDETLSESMKESLNNNDESSDNSNNQSKMVDPCQMDHCTSLTCKLDLHNNSKYLMNQMEKMILREKALPLLLYERVSAERTPEKRRAVSSSSEEWMTPLSNDHKCTLNALNVVNAMNAMNSNYDKHMMEKENEIQQDLNVQNNQNINNDQNSNYNQNDQNINNDQNDQNINNNQNNQNDQNINNDQNCVVNRVMDEIESTSKKEVEIDSSNSIHTLDNNMISSMNMDNDMNNNMNNNLNNNMNNDMDNNLNNNSNTMNKNLEKVENVNRKRKAQDQKTSNKRRKKNEHVTEE